MSIIIWFICNNLIEFLRLVYVHANRLHSYINSDSIWLWMYVHRLHIRASTLKARSCLISDSFLYYRFVADGKVARKPHDFLRKLTCKVCPPAFEFPAKFAFPRLTCSSRTSRRAWGGRSSRRAAPPARAPRPRSARPSAAPSGDPPWSPANGTLSMMDMRQKMWGGFQGSGGNVPNVAKCSRAQSYGDRQFVKNRHLLVLSFGHESYTLWMIDWSEI